MKEQQRLIPLDHLPPTIHYSTITTTTTTRRYDLPEKIAIAQQYLIPKARAEAGIPVGGEHVPESLTITEGRSCTHACVRREGGYIMRISHNVHAYAHPTDAGAIDSLVRWYCREAGVRNLEKHIEKACTRRLVMCYI